jgi:hypothetical protein
MQRWRQASTVAAFVRSRVGALRPKMIEPDASIRFLSAALHQEPGLDLMVSHNLVRVRYIYGSVWA